MTRAAPHMAARRRMLRLYPLMAGLGGALWIPNAAVANSGFVLGLGLMAAAVLGAWLDADRTA